MEPHVSSYTDQVVMERGMQYLGWFKTCLLHLSLKPPCFVQGSLLCVREVKTKLWQAKLGHRKTIKQQGFPLGKHFLEGKVGY